LKAETTSDSVLSGNRRGKQKKGAIMTEYPWDEIHQYRIVGSILTDERFMRKARRAVKPGYFTNRVHQTVAEIAFAHWDQYGCLASREVVVNKLVNPFYRAAVHMAFDFYNHTRVPLIGPINSCSLPRRRN
jgi:hypothetical protein